jgi:long-chain acyl-CoA synthetase
VTATATAPAAAPTGAAAGQPTLPALLLRHAAERPDAVALRDKHRGRWRETTWREYADRTAHAALGLRELGVAAGERVAIHAENRPEWLFADLGIQGLGAVSIGIYPTSPAAEVEYLLGHSEATVLIAEDEEQLDKALAVRERLPGLRRIVVIDPRGVRVLDDPMVITYAELERMGAAAHEADPSAFASAVEALEPEATAIIVYTSGTTGPPKGAMLSHANLMAAVASGQAAYPTTPDDEALSYLPLNHIAEKLFSEIGALGSGYVVNFGEGGESFAQDLRDVQPTIFLGVPRVWEKMLAGIEIRMQDASRIKRATYRTWTKRGRALARKRMRGGLSGADRLSGRVGDVMLFGALREKLGMARVKHAISGAAPIAPQVLEAFWAMGVPIREGYGQTEDTAVCTFMPADDVRIGTVGRPLPGVELRIAEDGEVLTRSAGVFKGYFRDEAATAQTISPDGWLHTGDVGVLDDDGFLTLTDRKKDIIITAGGKNISPSEIENQLKVSPYVREAVVIGDRRKYLTALIGIELDTVGDWATRHDVAYTTYGDLARKPEVRELIAGWVDQVNRDLAQVEEIKRFALLDKELDHEDGELTATQKVKRRALEERFSTQIEELYA